ncbi:MAG: hypothetical protein EAZ90_22470 [Oscillatoriales cyanobacterium]|nr:MAG: hypothetical protein EAZ90_22470 [Oscillatoriales cyanobacterium]TAE51282.1 MAG: hypothetical protein EAZ88_18505 [Oscillatoriales cyanobacterium]TAE66582.1 MAG: hypothetical protein EAZ86_19995 [Oscillatoriales cyanobacterium]TAF86579.1 MAG: hypothetical protein EAZ49_23020 [Oscillatoriales cyanobacterium]TAG01154.1 MAG: hypothetical protein EAZ45_13900 [Oscillatoriales cyanobacterium]
MSTIGGKFPAECGFAISDLTKTPLLPKNIGLKHPKKFLQIPDAGEFRVQNFRLLFKIPD